MVCSPPDICGGECCHIFDFKAGVPGDCAYLTEKGCSLPMGQRPITCLLYPLRLNNHRTLVLYIRVAQGAHCKGCYGHGKPVWLNLLPQLVMLFGVEVATKIEQHMRRNLDYTFNVPPWVTEKLKNERRLINGRA